MTPAELLNQAESLLLDFDGPLAALMPPPANARAAVQARRVLIGVDLPVELIETTDHLSVLRWTQLNFGGQFVDDVEAACTAAEVAAAQVCERGFHANALLDVIRSRKLPAAVVSNNSDLAVRAFLERVGWLKDFGAIACRTPETIDLMKPSPALINLAIDVLSVNASTALMVGDSIGDVIAAKAAGVKVLGLSKNAGRFEELTSAGADLVAPLVGGSLA